MHIGKVKLSDGHVPRHNRPEIAGGLRSRDFYIGKRQFGKADDTEQLEKGAPEGRGKDALDGRTQLFFISPGARYPIISPTCNHWLSHIARLILSQRYDQARPTSQDAGENGSDWTCEGPRCTCGVDKGVIGVGKRGESKQLSR